MANAVNRENAGNQWCMRPKRLFFATEGASDTKTKFRNEFFRKNWVYTRVSYLVLYLFGEILCLVNLDEDRRGGQQYKVRSKMYRLSKSAEFGHIHEVA